MGRKGTRGRDSGFFLLFVFVALTSFGGAARAQTYVVDTGEGAAVGGLSLTASQYLAGQFTLDAGHEINALEGWIIYPTISGDLPVDVVVYEDDGGVPDLTREIYFLPTLVPASGLPLSADWHGITIPPSLPLYLYGGRPYWLAFELPTADFGSGTMPPTPVAELDFYAIDSGAGYVANTTSRFGIRVLPEPGSGVMLVCGVGGLIGVSRSRRFSSGR